MGGAAQAGPDAWVPLAPGSGGALGRTGRELVHTGSRGGFSGLYWGGTRRLLSCTGSLGEVMGLYWEGLGGNWAILGAWEGLLGRTGRDWGTWAVLGRA